MKSKGSLGVLALKAGLEPSRLSVSSRLTTLLKISFSAFFSGINDSRSAHQNIVTAKIGRNEVFTSLIKIVP